MAMATDFFAQKTGFARKFKVPEFEHESYVNTQFHVVEQSSRFGVTTKVELGMVGPRCDSRKCDVKIDSLSV